MQPQIRAPMPLQGWPSCAQWGAPSRCSVANRAYYRNRGLFAIACRQQRQSARRAEPSQDRATKTYRVGVVRKFVGLRKSIHRRTSRGRPTSSGSRLRLFWATAARKRETKRGPTTRVAERSPLNCHWLSAPSRHKQEHSQTWIHRITDECTPLARRANPPKSGTRMP